MSRGRLRMEGTHLVSAEGRRYPVIDGIPVMLVSGIDQTLWVANASLAAAEHPDPEDPYFLRTLGVTDEQRENIRRSIAASGVSAGVDPVVSWIVAHTSGLAYMNLVGNLDRKSVV